MGTSKGEPTPLGDEALFAGGAVEIADRCWAWLQPNGGLGESNAGLVVGHGESLLIDTLWDERLSAAMLAELRPLAGADAPNSLLFNTHGDGDHWYGNGLLDETVEIVASAPAIEQMRSEPPAILTRMAPVGMAAGLLGRVPMLPGAERMRGLGAFGSMLDAYEFKGIEPRVAGSSFTESMGLDIGDREVELTFVGPAHTVGDAIAWVPDCRVVFAGDIFFNGVMPIMWAGPVSNWISALERIEQLEPEVVVGGHGPPGSIAEIAELRDYWIWLREQVLAAGPDPDVAKLTERLIRSADFERCASWRHPERTLVSVARIVATEADDSSEVSTLERIKLISSMGALAERLAS